MKSFIIATTEQIKDNMFFDPVLRKVRKTPIVLADEQESGYFIISTTVPDDSKFLGFKIYNRVSLKAAMNRIKKEGRVSNKNGISIIRGMNKTAISSCAGTHSFSIDPGLSAFQDFMVKKDVKFSSVNLKAVGRSDQDKVDVEILTLDDEVVGLPLKGCYILQDISQSNFEEITAYEGSVIRITYYNNSGRVVKVAVNSKLQTF